MQRQDNRRILIVDDNAAIHADFKKILATSAADESALHAVEAALFDDAPAASSPSADAFEVASAYQGQEALERVEAARRDGVPYAMAFVDMRMPPGWDGVETITELWKADADLQVVVCTAFADYTWPQMIEKLGRTDRLLILKKPFDAVEVQQLATSLTEKWNSLMRERQHVQDVMRAEREARAYSASLETMNHALEASWAKSEAESRQKSQFFAQVSSNVLSPIDALLLRSARAISVGDLETLAIEAAELSAPLRAVVDWTELDAGRAPADREVFAPLELLRAACNRPRGSRAIPVEISGLERLPDTLSGDARHLERALDELIANALRRAVAGPVRVEATLRMQRRSNAELSISISDDGKRLSRDELAHLFEPFSGDAKRDITLPLIKRIANALDGDLSCTSGPDAATRFTLTLPVEVVQAVG